MDDQGKIKVVDLPEPKRREVPPEVLAARRWNVAMAFLGLVTIYVGLHKLVIPLGLKLTPLRSSPYSHLDLWFFHPVLLYFSLKGRSSVTDVASFLAGGGIAYAGYELIQIFRGMYPGWLGFTHFLSSVPFGMICIVLLSGPYPGKSAKWAWVGVAIALLVKTLIPEIAKL